MHYLFDIYSLKTAVININQKLACVTESSLLKKNLKVIETNSFIRQPKTNNQKQFRIVSVKIINEAITFCFHFQFFHINSVITIAFQNSFIINFNKSTLSNSWTKKLAKRLILLERKSVCNYTDHFNFQLETKKERQSQNIYYIIVRSRNYNYASQLSWFKTHATIQSSYI